MKHDYVIRYVAATREVEWNSDNSSLTILGDKVGHVVFVLSMVGLHEEAG